MPGIGGFRIAVSIENNNLIKHQVIYEPNISLVCTFEILFSHRDEMSAVEAKETISSIRILEY